MLDLDKRFKQLLRAKYLYTVNFAINNKELEIAPYLAVHEIYDVNIIFLDTIYGSLPKEVRKSIYGKALKDLLKERRKLKKLEEKVEKQ